MTTTRGGAKYRIPNVKIIDPPSMAEEPLEGQGLLIIEASR
jgi:hypothetical protein